MWNSYAKLKRLETALERCGLNPSQFSALNLMNTLERRGCSDNKLSSIVTDLLTFLEPPNCYMSHCENYGGQRAPCNCGIKQIPGRCSILKAYKLRKKERVEKNAASKEAVK